MKYSEYEMIAVRGSDWGSQDMEEEDLFIRDDSFHVSDDGEYFSKYFILKFDDILPREIDSADGLPTRGWRDLMDMLVRDYPIQHCSHSYDCCGHWYANGIQVTRIDDYSLLLIQGFVLNV